MILCELYFSLCLFNVECVSYLQMIGVSIYTAHPHIFMGMVMVCKGIAKDFS